MTGKVTKNQSRLYNTQQRKNHVQKVLSTAINPRPKIVLLLHQDNTEADGKLFNC